jgi:hypothetical protein
MPDEKPKPGQQTEDPSDEVSKGQYGGLTGLGPGGGSDLEEALDFDDDTEEDIGKNTEKPGKKGLPEGAPVPPQGRAP